LCHGLSSVGKNAVKPSVLNRWWGSYQVEFVYLCMKFCMNYIKLQTLSRVTDII